MSRSGTVVNGDRDDKIVRFISGQMGNLAREKKFTPKEYTLDSSWK
jgi:hypothetical protein